MTRRAAHRLTWRQALGWVVGLHVLLAALFAPGVMPAFASGGAELVICTAYGPQVLTTDPDGAPDDSAAAFCDWALVHGAAALLGDLPAPEARPVTFAAAEPAPARRALVPRRDASSPGARGPPGHL
ncbi:hypothetical protein [Seohaeicola zhoushanensis]|uniref:DUF2946 domain-containing protein n=1 Tax=Seohaeicola zhoushanensis TaxID=1569283 RepID=A0A8J3M4G5_9RHOB|nr:hypothetical protein [Seohaeicola zhoushanensis]GHF37986.1 hypothetical protein GCM10017056_07420 [Seohaeicola zhoushanensis]